MAARVVEIANGVPGLAAEGAVTWPKRTKARLSNGLEVILAEAHSIPKFHGELFFRSGNAAANHRAPGLAEMTATVVRTGTKKRASRQKILYCGIGILPMNFMGWKPMPIHHEEHCACHFVACGDR